MIYMREVDEDEGEGRISRRDGVLLREKRSRSRDLSHQLLESGTHLGLAMEALNTLTSSVSQQ